MDNFHFLFLLLAAGIYTHSIAAPPEVLLTVSVQGDGTVTSEPGSISCPDVCDESFKKGTTVTLNAFANTDSTFLGWGGACAGNDLTCAVKLTAPTEVIAKFEAVVTPQAFPATGQTSCRNDPDCTNPASAGQDGDIQAGAALSYTDNGDGTITDDNTGLMWIKQDDNNALDPLACNSYPGNLDKDCRFTPVDAYSFVANLNANIHAGYSDWRVPNVKELQSIVNYQNVNPAVSIAFNDSCMLGCKVPDCSCTATYPPNGASVYWTSTHVIDNANSQWSVFFVRGSVRNLTNDELHSVRAVRGGL